MTAQLGARRAAKTLRRLWRYGSRTAADFPVTVQAVRSVAVVDFERTVNGNLSSRFLVSHGAFGTGPVRFHVLKGVGRFRQSHRTREMPRVPEGGLVVITLQASLPARMIVVYNRRPRADRPSPRPNN